jgi:imidazolonepropionase-like amidohydrolase
MRSWTGANIVAGCLLTAFAASAQEQAQVFRGATLYPISSPPIEGGVLVVHEGKIVAVGGPATASPPGAREHDATGKVILPGLVDAHSHVGGPSGGDSSAPLHPDARALDSIDVRSDSFWRARSGGLTTVNVMPGSGHLLSGQTVYLKLRKDPRSIEDWLYCDDAVAGVCGGLKMANGTNSIDDPPFPGTRAKSAALVRQLYVDAQEYQRKLDAAAAGADAEPPDRSLRLETLLEAMRGERIVQHHTHRYNDIMTVLRLRQEFGFRVVLQHASESWKVADEIAAAGVPVSLTVVDAPGGKEETIDVSFATGRILEQAGVDVGFNTDDSITDSRLLFRAAALSVRYGMSRQKALEGLTLAPARMLGLESRIGSLAAGKDADFVVLSGDPLSVYTKVETTWVEGETVFDRADPEQRKYAVGGYKVYRPDPRDEVAQAEWEAD